MPLVLLILAAVVPAPSPPIMVMGHAWAPFISPMGEPFRARSVTDDTLADWFAQADLNHDGVLTALEFQADADRFFATLDSDNDGQIEPPELDRYEYEVAPEIQTMSRTKRVAGQPASAEQPADDDLDGNDRAARHHRRQRTEDELALLGIGGALQGAARYSLLNIPEPVAAADADFDRAVTQDEFRQAAAARFQLLDSAHQGRLTLAQLEAMPHAPPLQGHRRKLDVDAPDTRIGNALPTGN
jgi:hypothetical protein